MRRPCRLAVRLALIAVVVAALPLVAGSHPSGTTPYLSSLSSLGASAALAAPGCNSKYCSKEPGRKSPTCVQSSPLYNCSASHGVCTITGC